MNQMVIYDILNFDLYYRLYIYGGKRLFIISGNSDRESITSPIPMTIVRDEESHPFRGAAIKYRQSVLGDSSLNR